MRRPKVDPPSPKKVGSKKKLGKPDPKHMRRPEVAILDAQQCMRVAQMKLQGAPVVAIARELEVDERTVHRMLDRARAEFMRDYATVARDLVNQNLQTIDRMMLTWFPLATGKLDAAGNVLVPPDDKAARIVEGLVAQRTKLAAFAVPNRVELTGAAGGPVVVADARDLAAVMRSTFGGHVSRTPDARMLTASPVDAARTAEPIKAGEDGDVDEKSDRAAE